MFLSFYVENNNGDAIKTLSPKVLKDTTAYATGIE
jgi:hypothetical protein